MPRVQVRKSQGTKVRTTPLRGGQTNIQTSEDSFGGGASLRKTQASTDKLLGTSLKIEVNRRAEMEKEALRQKTIADNTAYQDADLLLSKTQTDIDNSVKQMRGKNALGAIDFANDTWKEKSAEIRSTLINDEQRAKFDQSVKNREANIYKSTQGHMAIESEKQRVASFNSYTLNERDQAASNYTNEAGEFNYAPIRLSLHNQEEAFVNFAQDNGADGETISKGLKDIRTKTHTAVLASMVSDGNTEMAAQYFEANEDQIDGDELKAGIKSTLKDQSDRDLVMDKVSEISSQIGNELNQAQSKINEIKDPKVRQAAEKEMKVVIQKKQQAHNHHQATMGAAIADDSFDHKLLEINRNQMPKADYSVFKKSLNVTAGVDHVDDKVALSYRDSILKTAMDVSDDAAAKMKLLRLQIINDKNIVSENDYPILLQMTHPEFIGANNKKINKVSSALSWLSDSTRVATLGIPNITSITLNMLSKFTDDALSKNMDESQIYDNARQVMSEIQALANPNSTKYVIGETYTVAGQERVAIQKKDGSIGFKLK